MAGREGVGHGALGVGSGETYMCTTSLGRFGFKYDTRCRLAVRLVNLTKTYEDESDAMLPRFAPLNGLPPAMWRGLRVAVKTVVVGGGTQVRKGRAGWPRWTDVAWAVRCTWPLARGIGTSMHAGWR